MVYAIDSDEQKTVATTQKQKRQKLKKPQHKNSTKTSKMTVPRKRSSYFFTPVLL